MKTELLCIIMLFLILASCDKIKEISSPDQDDPAQIEESDDLVEVTETITEDCYNCNGYGYVNYTCSKCNGYGIEYCYVSETRPKRCSRCGGMGAIRCDRCDGFGYIWCNNCNGNGRLKCSTCGGYGIIVSYDPEHPWNCPNCYSCNGTGYVDCYKCDGSGKIMCCGNGSRTCPQCYGTGCYGQEEYSYNETVTCSHCNGTGACRSICSECNGTGIITSIRTVLKHKSEL